MGPNVMQLMFLENRFKMIRLVERNKRKHTKTVFMDWKTKHGYNGYSNS